MTSHLIPQQDSETGLYDISTTGTARSVGFMGRVWVTPALWQVCIWRTGTDPSWSDRTNELLTSLRGTFNKAASDARNITFTPPFGHFWKPLKATFLLGDSGRPEILVQLLTEAERRWP